MKLPKDKNGRTINPGDTIRLTFNARQRERPGGRRVAIQGLSGNEVIVSDEGGLLAPAVHWVDFAVEWDGACLMARRVSTSDFQAVMSGECTSVSTGKPVSASSAMEYLNSVFNGADFEVMN
jgi:hypothetical protein